MNKSVLSVVVLLLFYTFCLSTGESAGSLEGWTEYAQRPALMPEMVKNLEAGTLDISSSGNFRCNGAWKKSVAVIPGKYFRFHTEYLAQNVSSPRRSILARVYWRDRQGNQVSKPEYPRLIGSADSGWKILEDTVEVPEGAATADLELIFRWDTEGKVSWKNFSFNPSSKPEARSVTLATVNYRHQNSAGPKDNLEAYGKYIDEAGKAGAQILCLPEGVTVVGTGKSYLEIAEPVPGPTTQFLGELAKKHQMYIAAGIYEIDGETTYNTAVFIGKNGELVGRYRKVSLPRGPCCWRIGRRQSSTT